MSEPSTGALRQQSYQRVIRPANLLPLVALVLFGTLLANYMQSLSGPAVWQALSSISVWQWAAAAVFTALSFRAVGTYDVLVHKLLGTGVPARAARRSGIVAIALAQTLGFGAITGALARWRCLSQFGPRPASSLGSSPGSNLGPATLARLSVVVSVSFLVALAALGALVIPLSGVMPLQSSWLAVSLVAVAGLFILARLAFRQRWIPAPLTLPVFSALFWATFLDTSFAAAALWILWPDPISFHLVFAAYLIALAAGLVSNCPGGLGAFDLTLLGVLQVSDTNGAAAAILGFRLIYYIVPAVLAFILLLRPAAKTPPQPVDHPEGTLALQSANVISHHGTPLLTLPCWGKGAVYGDMPLPHVLPKMPIYKCSATQALVARKKGWSVLRCANEALIDAQTWSLQGSQKRQLRRALSAFSKSNLRVRPARTTDDLHPAANAWTAAHGRERGHSMGRFDVNYLQHQQVFVALDGDTVVGFASFHTTASPPTASPTVSQWTLDIMRHTADLPKGTMQALVAAALDAAQAAGVTTVSLAAVPHPAKNLPFARLARTRSSGLYRFKSAFAPRWSPRYICARNPVSLALTMATLAWAIHRPQPLANSVPKHNEHYSFAPPRPSCDSISSL